MRDQVYTLLGKNSSGKSDETFPQRIQGKVTKFYNETFSPTNEAIKELLSNTKDIEAFQLYFNGGKVTKKISGKNSSGGGGGGGVTKFSLGEENYP